LERERSAVKIAGEHQREAGGTVTYQPQKVSFEAEGLMPHILLVPAPLGLCAQERNLSSPYNLGPLGRPHQHQDWRYKRLYLSGPA